MFKVDFYVDDKRLGAALLALIGIAHGQPGVTPVANATVNGGKVVAKVNGSSLDQFAEQLKKLKGQPFRARDVDALMKTIGLAPTSRTYMLQRAVEEKLVKKHGVGSAMTYTVI